jgi:hypothetical protein
MSIGSLGIIGSLSAAPLSQKTAESDRAERESADANRATQGEQAAESAAGIGETEEDSQTAERDADGRRLWERSPEKKTDEAAAREEAGPAHLSKDPTGDAGGELDLMG